MVHQMWVTFPASSPSFSWGWAHRCPSGYYIASSFPICPPTGHAEPSSTPFWGNRDVMGSEAGLEQTLQLIQRNQETERGRGCAFPLVLLGCYPTPTPATAEASETPFADGPTGSDGTNSHRGHPRGPGAKSGPQMWCVWPRQCF